MGSSLARPALWAHTSLSLGGPAASPVVVGCSPSTRVPPLSRTVRQKVRGQLLRDTFPHTTFCFPRPTPKSEERSRDSSSGHGLPVPCHTERWQLDSSLLNTWSIQHLKGVGGPLRGEGEEERMMGEKGRMYRQAVAEGLHRSRNTSPSTILQLPLSNVPRPSPPHSLYDTPLPIRYPNGPL